MVKVEFLWKYFSGDPATLDCQTQNWIVIVKEAKVTGT